MSCDHGSSLEVQVSSTLQAFTFFPLPHYTIFQCESATNALTGQAVNILFFPFVSCLIGLEVFKKNNEY